MTLKHLCKTGKFKNIVRNPDGVFGKAFKECTIAPTRQFFLYVLVSLNVEFRTTQEFTKSKIFIQQQRNILLQTSSRNFKELNENFNKFSN